MQVFGTTWSAPMVVITADEVRGMVEKEMAEKEYALKEKKKGKRPASVKDAPATSGAIAIEDDDVWSIPSDSEAKPAAGKGAKTGKGADDTDAATAARKAERLRVQAWKKEIGKATKCLQALTSVTQSLTLQVDKDKKTPGVLAEDTQKGLMEAREKLSKLKARNLARIKTVMCDKSTFLCIENKSTQRCT